MELLRISKVEPGEKFTVRLTLTDGSVVDRDLSGLLQGPMFQGVREDPSAFRAVSIENGTLVWPNGADLCPDVVIWGGLPPAEVTGPAPTLAPSAAP
jgi:hypothetical protein